MSKLLKASLRKTVAGIVAFATILSLSGVIAFAPVAQAAVTIVDGDLIKSNAVNSDGTPTYASLDVYIVKLVGAKKFKRLILNPTVFSSYGHLNAANIKTVDQATMDSYKTAALVRVDTDPAQKVFALAPNGDIGAKSWVNVTTADFLAAGADADSVYTINSVDGGNYTAVADITTSAQVSTFLTTGVLPNVTPVTSGLTVGLAADSPAATTQASGTAYNKVLKLNVTASADSSVSINSLTVTRGGISIDSNISGVAVFDADGKRHGNFVTFADTKATANFTSDPIVVPAGATQAIWVKTNISGTTGTYNVSVVKSSDIGTTAAVSGSFPISSSTFSLTSGTSVVGAVTVDAVLVHNNGTNDGTAVNVNLGVTNQEISRFRFVANANENIKISKITMYNNGNTNDADIKNIKLVAPDGSILATVVQAANRNVVFDLSAAPFTILKGNTKDLSVRIDVVGGSTRNVRLVIQNDYDIEVYGADTGSGILATAATTVDGAFPIGDTSAGGTNCSGSTNCINKLTIAAGTALFNKASDSPTGNIPVGTSGLTLGKWEFTPQGEDMEVRQVTYTLTYGTVLTGTFKIQVNGSTVYSVAPISMGATGVATTVTLNSYPTIVAGQKAIFTVVGDTSSTVASGATYLAALDIVQVKRMATNDLVDPVVSSTAASTLTVSTAALSIAKNSSFPNSTVVAGLSNAKVGSFNLTASATEDVSVSSLTVALTNITNISNLMVKVGDKQYGSTTTTPIASNVVSISDLTVTKGTSVALDVYVTTNSSTTGTEVASITAASATGKASGTTVTATGLTATGQTITFSVGGTLSLSLDTTNTPVAAIAHSGETGRTLLVTRVTSNNAEAIKVQTVQVSATNGAASLKDLMLFVDGVQVGTTVQLNNSVASFTAVDQTVGLFTVPQDKTVVLTVKGATTNTSALNSQAVANVSLDYVEAMGVSGGQKIKPGTTTSTTWSATNITAAGASITVADTTGFHRGDVVFAYDGTNGGTLGIVTAEPTSTTAMTVSGLAAKTLAGSATISKVETGATTAASAGTSGTATADVSYTVTSTTGFAANDPVIINGATTSQLGIVISVTNSTTIVIRALSATATGTAVNISKIGTDTLGTTGATISAAQAPTATTVASTTGFSVGDMVLFSDIAGGNAGTFCMVTAVGSTTSMTLGCNAAVTGTAGTQLVVRVGSANPSTTLVTTAASAGNRVIAATATTVTDTTGFGAADVTLSIAATGGAILGKVGAITNATTLTVASAAASATTTTRLTRLPAAASAGSILTLHDVEPIISLTNGFVGGNATGTTGHEVGKFDIKADGDRNMNITSLNVQANGSNLPWNYVTSYDLYNGSTLLSSATALNFSTTSTGTNALTGTTIKLCGTTADVGAAGEIDATSMTAANLTSQINVNDTIVLFATAANYITAKVTAVAVTTGACGGTDVTDTVLTVSNSSTAGTAPTSGTITKIKSFNIYFNANSTTPLATQTITAGSALTLTIKADTTNVRSGLSSGTTASYNVKINGTQGSSNGGLTWGYTPSGGSAITGLTISDSYPVNGPTFTF